MEEHRLKPMKEGYNQELFLELFQKTEGLRRKLASEINHKKFHLEYEDMVSWFDIKFIFVFNKYVDEMPKDRLKGFLINALKTYKNRVLRYSYQERFMNNPIQLVDNYELVDTVEETEFEEKRAHMLDITYTYMRSQLTDDAFQVFDIQLNPPPFIVDKMKQLELHNLTKIPPILIADYLNFGTSLSAQKYVSELRQEIRGALKLAQEFLPKYF